MGSTGAFLETGGFKWQGWEDTGEKLCGLKVLKKKTSNPNESQSLPLYSDTPGTAYVLLDEDGNFKQMIQYGEDRRPEFELNYGPDDNKESFHLHRRENGKRQKAEIIASKEEGIVNQALYNKFKKFLKGIDL